CEMSNRGRARRAAFSKRTANLACVGAHGRLRALADGRSRFARERKVRTPPDSRPWRIRGRSACKRAATDSVTENRPPGAQAAGTKSGLWPAKRGVSGKPGAPSLFAMPSVECGLRNESTATTAEFRIPRLEAAQGLLWKMGIHETLWRSDSPPFPKHKSR